MNKIIMLMFKSKIHPEELAILMLCRLIKYTIDFAAAVSQYVMMLIIDSYDLLIYQPLLEEVATTRLPFHLLHVRRR